MLVVIGTCLLALAGLVAYVLALLGARSENKPTDLPGTAPNWRAAYARRVMGVYVRRPKPAPEHTDRRDLTTTGRR
ncbi:hypothetical protein EDD29_7275 [Actinocorallia herbida]|uniref:Uncharacterized protein n=1 Tax=Actinocorallia herbida TaxID=58109 RepID=A0A3N1D7U8_9ACTN|nr:hypothetical protein [Actinocorallia herbida]ROO89576.1 hypothetical protein EDD29_7275 [Actinocorallia herbida]